MILPHFPVFCSLSQTHTDLNFFEKNEGFGKYDYVCIMTTFVSYFRNEGFGKHDYVCIMTTFVSYFRNEASISLSYNFTIV